MNNKKTLIKFILGIFVIVLLSECKIKTTTTLSKSITTEYPKDSLRIVQSYLRTLYYTNFDSLCKIVYKQFPEAKKGYIEKLDILCKKEDNIDLKSDTSKFKLIIKFTLNYESNKIKEGQEILDYYISLLVKVKKKLPSVW